MQDRLLYDRLGGKEVDVAVVDDFVAPAAADSRINPKFVRTDVPRLKAMLVEQVCAATGGPLAYTGRGMRETHDGMRVTAGEFDALVADLVATLKLAREQAEPGAARHDRGDSAVQPALPSFSLVGTACETQLGGLFTLRLPS